MAAANRAELFVLALALAKLGATEVAVAPWLDDDAARHVLTDSQAVLLVGEDPEPAWATTPVLAASDLDSTAVAGSPRRLTGTQPPAATVAYGAGRTACPAARCASSRPSACARPRPSSATSRAASACAATRTTCSPLPPPTPPRCCSRAAHARARRRGGLPRPVQTRAALALIEEHAITSTFLLAGHARSARSSSPTTSRRRPTSRRWTPWSSAAGRCHPGVREAGFDLLGEDCLYVAYGTAHTGTVALQDPDDRPEAAGRPLAGIEVRTEKGVARPLPLALTRWQDGEPAGDFVATGDRGRLDDDGLLVLE